MRALTLTELAMAIERLMACAARHARLQCSSTPDAVAIDEASQASDDALTVVLNDVVRRCRVYDAALAYARNRLSGEFDAAVEIERRVDLIEECRRIIREEGNDN